MTPERQIGFWAAGLAIFLLLLWLLSGILLPFVAGMAVAYFFDPACDRLQRAGLGRTTATAMVTAGFVLGVVLALVLLLPAAIDQANDILRALPELADLLRERAGALLTGLAVDHPQVLQKLRETASNQAGDLASWLSGFADGLFSGGLALLNLLSLLFITPVVAFFLLRDWDALIERIDGWLPRQHAPTIRCLAREADHTLSAYVRGMATVCLVLGGFYALSLSILGLQGGLLVGLFAGALSFIPYLGAIGGLLLSVGLALAQFDSLWMVGATAAVFLFGQAVEGNFLTPKLVGDQVGLHPVVVIFVLLAGGTLFGFTGVLLALPMAAVAGVLVRFALEQYLKSTLYRQRRNPDDGAAS